MHIITIKPADGRLIRDPCHGREIIGETRVDADDAFWLRCLASGDVVKTDQGTKKIDPAKEKK